MRGHTAWNLQHVRQKLEAELQRSATIEQQVHEEQRRLLAEQRRQREAASEAYLQFVNNPVRRPRGHNVVARRTSAPAPFPPGDVQHVFGEVAGPFAAVATADAAGGGSGRERGSLRGGASPLSSPAASPNANADAGTAPFSFWPPSAPVVAAAVAPPAAAGGSVAAAGAAGGAMVEAVCAAPAGGSTPGDSKGGTSAADGTEVGQAASGYNEEDVPLPLSAVAQPALGSLGSGVSANAATSAPGEAAAGPANAASPALRRPQRTHRRALTSPTEAVSASISVLAAAEPDSEQAVPSHLAPTAATLAASAHRQRSVPAQQPAQPMQQQRQLPFPQPQLSSQQRGRRASEGCQFPLFANALAPPPVHNGANCSPASGHRGSLTPRCPPTGVGPQVAPPAPSPRHKPSGAIAPPATSCAGLDAVATEGSSTPARPPPSAVNPALVGKPPPVRYSRPSPSPLVDSPRGSLNAARETRVAPLQLLGLQDILDKQAVATPRDKKKDKPRISVRQLQIGPCRSASGSHPDSPKRRPLQPQLSYPQPPSQQQQQYGTQSQLAQATLGAELLTARGAPRSLASAYEGPVPWMDEVRMIRPWSTSPSPPGDPTVRRSAPALRTSMHKRRSTIEASSFAPLPRRQEGAAAAVAPGGPASSAEAPVAAEPLHQEVADEPTPAPAVPAPTSSRTDIVPAASEEPGVPEAGPAAPSEEAPTFEAPRRLRRERSKKHAGIGAIATGGVGAGTPRGSAGLPFSLCLDDATHLSHSGSEVSVLCDEQEEPVVVTQHEGFASVPAAPSDAAAGPEPSSLLAQVACSPCSPHSPLFSAATPAAAHKEMLTRSSSASSKSTASAPPVNQSTYALPPEAPQLPPAWLASVSLSSAAACAVVAPSRNASSSDASGVCVGDEGGGTSAGRGVAAVQGLEGAPGEEATAAGIQEACGPEELREAVALAESREALEEAVASVTEEVAAAALAEELSEAAEAVALEEKGEAPLAAAGHREEAPDESLLEEVGLQEQGPPEQHELAELEAPRGHMQEDAQRTAEGEAEQEEQEAPQEENEAPREQGWPGQRRPPVALALVEDAPWHDDDGQKAAADSSSASSATGDCDHLPLWEEEPAKVVRSPSALMVPKLALPQTTSLTQGDESAGDEPAEAGEIALPDKDEDQAHTPQPEGLIDLLRRALPSFISFGGMFRGPADGFRTQDSPRGGFQVVTSPAGDSETMGAAGCRSYALSNATSTMSLRPCAVSADDGEVSPTFPATRTPPAAAVAAAAGAPELAAGDNECISPKSDVPVSPVETPLARCSDGSTGLTGSLPLQTMQRKLSEVLGEDLLICATETADKVEAISNEPKTQQKRSNMIREDCILEEGSPSVGTPEPMTPDAATPRQQSPAAAVSCEQSPSGQREEGEGSVETCGDVGAELETATMAETATPTDEAPSSLSLALPSPGATNSVEESLEDSAVAANEPEAPQAELAAEEPELMSPTGADGDSRMNRINSDLFATAIDKVVPPQLSKQPGRAAGGMVLLHRARDGVRNLGDDHDDGAATVLKLFYDSMPENCIEIGCIQQVVQVRLLKRFLNKVAEARASIEATFHGTKKDCVESIMQHGLEPSLCHTGAYGRGAYVGTHAGVAHQYADPDARGWRHMFVFLVVVGDKVMKGREGEQASVTAMDRLLNPTQYCFVDASRLYVSHLIRYRVTEGVGGRVGGGWDDPFLRALNLAVFRASQLEQRSGRR